VRRAREMMEAGVAPQMPSQIPRPPPQNAYDQPRAAPSPPKTNRNRPPMPPALVSTRSGPGPIGVAISRPTQVPQWPLAATIEGGPDPQYQPPPGRGVPPQRPPRPSHVPSMLDASRLQDPTPSFQYTPQGQDRYEEEDVISPIMASPLTQSSRPSTMSSVGSIPDFPVPMPPSSGPPRRSANLGPPPSSRRGASSYYSQASFVSPIPEESPRTVPSHQSYASSAAMPTSWGSDSPRYDEDDYEDEEVYDSSPDFQRIDRGFGSPIEEGRESRGSGGSNGDDSDDRGLIRSASFGRRAKPSMITTRSAEKIEPVRPQAVPQQMQTSKLEKMGVIAGVGTTTGLVASKSGENGQRETVWPIIGDVNSPLASGTGLIDKSTTSSEETVPTIARAITTNAPAPAYVASRDPKEIEMLGAYNAASSLQPGPSPSRTPSPGFSRLSAIRRPPRLDMDAVRDAEARGSLTSLPDLIRRATRLAAMMDRGKRPGSRMALNDWPADDMEKDPAMGCRYQFLFLVFG
jgi:hypothetical protein